MFGNLILLARLPAGLLPLFSEVSKLYTMHIDHLITTMNMPQPQATSLLHIASLLQPRCINEQIS